MFKGFLCLAALLGAAAAFAAVDLNAASEAELDGIKGIGPALSGRLLAERRKAPFKDWADLVGRVKGIGPASARKLSSEGLTVNGAAFDGPPSSAQGRPADR